jgi:chorismate-pyruvate lyase
MNPAPSIPAARASRNVSSDVYPLDEFYAARHSPLPTLGRLEAAELPEPYRALLAHNGDMTSKLEAFHQAKIHIHLLARHQRGSEYFREVVLLGEGSEQPVEFGAIKIMLDLFPAEAQQEILRERQPLGKILTAFGVSFRSQPRAFLRMESDSFIEDALRLGKTHLLYGRRNTLVDPAGRPLAEIVEILPPTALKSCAAASMRSAPSQSLQS